MYNRSARILLIVRGQDWFGHARPGPWTVLRWRAATRPAPPAPESFKPRGRCFRGLLTLVLLGGLAGGLPPADAGLTSRVSVASTGAQGNSDSSTPTPSVSAEGRLVAFTSRASNLVAGDTNNRHDVFVHDRLGRVTEVCGGFAVTLLGTPGPDVLVGTRGPDVIHGGAGNDHLRGGAGDDLLCGGPGADTLLGGTGNDRLEGMAGADILLGGAGNDRLFGGSDNDRLFGEDGNDRLVGGRGNDQPVGGAGADWLAGATGADTLDGSLGHDICNGGEPESDDTAVNCETVRNVP